MDVFTLAAKLKLDSSDFSKDIKKQETVFQKFGGTAKKMVSGVAKFTTLTVSTIGAALIPVIKSATSAFANYEQLVGGVETLFKEASVFVQQDADKAFKEAGLSANEYMETATSFAASLIQGLSGDTLAAAEYANRAIVDMSDNANKMGTDITSIQNAYRGFSKQNFTMLDNLKLGYGGTKTEMERLLKDAEELTGRKFDVSNFADIVDAIHAIQVQMDIAGTTAKEASTTITGSWNATKAAWQNLLVAMADPKGNIKKATKNLVDSGKTVLKNVLPIINQSISGIGDMLSEVAPLIGEALPAMVVDLTPKLLETGKNLISGISKGISKFANKIKWPKWEDIRAFASRAWNSVVTGVKDLGNTVGKAIFGENVDGSIKWPTWDDVKDTAERLWGEIVDGAAALSGLVFGDTDKAAGVFDAIRTAWTNLRNTIETKAINIGTYFFGEENGEQVANAIKTIMDVLVAFGTGFVVYKAVTGITSIVNSLKQLLTLQTVGNPTAAIIGGIATAFMLIAQNWDTIEPALVNAVDWLRENVFEPVSGFFQDYIIGPFTEGLNWIKQAIKDIASFIGVDTRGWFGDTSVKNMSANTAQYLTDQFEKARRNDELGKFSAMFKKELVDLGYTDEAIQGIWDAMKASNFSLAYFQTLLERMQTINELMEAAQETATQIEESAPEPTYIHRPKNNIGLLDEVAFAPAPEEIQDMRAYIQDLYGFTPKARALLELYERMDELLNSTFASQEEIDEATETFYKALEMAKERIGEAESAIKKVGEAAQSVSGTYSIDFVVSGLKGSGGGGVSVGGSGATGMEYISLGTGTPLTDLFRPHAKGSWNVPYDNYPALLHRNEMVLTASQARRHRDNDGDSMSDLLSAIQGMRQDLQNLKFQVSGKDFGRVVVEYGGNRVRKQINDMNKVAQAGYGS